MGGWGDIPPEEFLEGSDRLRAFARRTGLKFTDWRLKNHLLERGPESEWGSEPGLAESLESFCKEEGYRYVHVDRACLPGDNIDLVLRYEKEFGLAVDETGDKPGTGNAINMNMRTGYPEHSMPPLTRKWL